MVVKVRGVTFPHFFDGDNLIILLYGWGDGVRAFYDDGVCIREEHGYVNFFWNFGRGFNWVRWFGGNFVLAGDLL